MANLTTSEQLQIAIKALQAIARNEAWAMATATHALERIAQAQEQKGANNGIR
jgi:hypothetical protein